MNFSFCKLEFEDEKLTVDDVNNINIIQNFSIILNILSTKENPLSLALGSIVMLSYQ